MEGRKRKYIPLDPLLLSTFRHFLGRLIHGPLVYRVECFREHYWIHYGLSCYTPGTQIPRLNCHQISIIYIKSYQAFKHLHVTIDKGPRR
jgi:hypothetical protein